jgi:hypothetical protein
VIATGLARGARARGKRIAFGDGRRILWDNNSELIFRGNPNIAPPGHEGAPDLEWMPFYKGHRIYNRHDAANNRWVWNMDFRPTPGQMFFDPIEKVAGQRYASRFIIVEPNIEQWKSIAPNKDWGRAKYQEIVDRLNAEGWRVAQFAYGPMLSGVEALRSKNFRDALSILSNAALYIGPEGGLHHGAAAVGINAVVLFGGFIPPSVTGYPNHANLTGGSDACGSLKPCAHCTKAMAAISVDDVYKAAKERL